MRKQTILYILLLVSGMLQAQVEPGVRLVNVSDGWAANSVNAVVFRKNSLATFKDTQFIAFYNQERYVMLGKRKLGEEKWVLQQTTYRGNTSDAHNSISIMVDDAGYLHLSWDHHNNPLRYARSIAPGSLQLTDKLTMTGSNEQNVTYPEFYNLSDGDLLFLYRDGRSGQGNLVINKYYTATQRWQQLHSNLIDGEGKRNAYWQACVDGLGTIHISWVWRESPDVASNHDLCYARSVDGGKTWERSTGEKYQLPVTAATAEYTCRIPQNSELINQTSMSADNKGNPFIASYWREADSKVPQYHIVYLTANGWKVRNLHFRKTAFSLSGAGTKRIPVSRPQVMVKGSGNKASVLLLFRDEERGSKASAVVINKIKKNRWTVLDLTTNSLGSWEPTYDTGLWREKKLLHLFVQRVEQVDAEGKANIPPQPVQVLEWQPKF
jgi:hypothetical protein